MQEHVTMATGTTGRPHDLSGDELALVLDAACAALFQIDVATGEVHWSGSLAALTGGAVGRRGGNGRMHRGAVLGVHAG